MFLVLNLDEDGKAYDDFNYPYSITEQSYRKSSIGPTDVSNGYIHQVNQIYFYLNYLLNFWRDSSNNSTCSSLLDVETVGTIFFGFKHCKQSTIRKSKGISEAR